MSSTATVREAYKVTKELLFKFTHYRAHQSRTTISTTFINMNYKNDIISDYIACNMPSNICILSTIPNLIQELKALLPDFRFTEVANASDESLKTCPIIIGDFDLLAPHLFEFPKLKWMQGTWAGVETITPYINNPLRYTITRFSGECFGQMISEYVIAIIVNRERDFLKVVDNRRSKIWAKEGNIEKYRQISDLTVGILGVGNIGSWLGKCLHMFGAKVLGYGRRPAIAIDINSKEYNYMTSYFTQANLSDMLKGCDYIVNTLPHTSETDGLLNGNILENCKEQNSYFINVGRGSIINEADLINALDKTWISGATLDVFVTEPLPADNLLWTTPNVHITPHVAAVSMAKPIAEHFQQNLKFYLARKPIPNALKFGSLY